MNLSSFTSEFRSKLIISVYQKWIKKGNKVLDIGCGTGVVTKALQDKLSIKISGCDLENYLSVKIPFKKIASDILPFKTKSFDIAMLNDVLHHMPKQKQTHILLEAIRISKKVLIFEFEPTPIGKLLDILLNKLHYKNLDDPVSLREIPDWEDLFKKLGLKSQIIKPKKPFWYPFSPIAFMLTKI